MKRLFLFLVVLAASSGPCFAQNRTVVRDVLYNADGTRPSGQVQVAWEAFTSADNRTVAGGRIIKKIVDGALEVSLIPNEGATPTGTSYTVNYLLGSSSYQETWVIPSSSTPVNLSLVRSTPLPTPGMVIAQSQVAGLVTDLQRKIDTAEAQPTSGRYLLGNGSVWLTSSSPAAETGEANLFALPQSITAEVSNTEGWGLKINPATGSAANVYGLWVSDQKTGANNWNIWSGPSSSLPAAFGNYDWALNVFAATSDSYNGSPLAVVGSSKFGEFGLQVYEEDTGSDNQPGMGPVAGYFEAAFAGTGNHGPIYAVDAQARNSSTGTASDAYGLAVESTVNSGGGTIVENYGIYVKDQTAGTNNWAIKTGRGLVEFGDQVTSPNINQVRFANQFPGVDAGAKIAAAIADLPAAGGTVDARGLTGPQTIASTITISKPVRILFGPTTLTSSADPAITAHSVRGVGLVGSWPSYGTLSGTVIRGKGGNGRVLVCVDCSKWSVENITFDGNGTNGVNTYWASSNPAVGCSGGNSVFKDVTFIDGSIGVYNDGNCITRWENVHVTRTATAQAGSIGMQFDQTNGDQNLLDFVAVSYWDVGLSTGKNNTNAGCLATHATGCAGGGVFTASNPTFEQSSSTDILLGPAPGDPFVIAHAFTEGSNRFLTAGTSVGDGSGPVRIDGLMLSGITASDHRAISKPWGGVWSVNDAQIHGKDNVFYAAAGAINISGGHFDCCDGVTQTTPFTGAGSYYFLGQTLVHAYDGNPVPYGGSACSAYQNAGTAQPAADNIWTVIQFDVNESCTSTFHSTSVNNTRFSVPSAGSWMMTGTVSFPTTIGTHLTCYFKKNGNYFKGGTYLTSGASGVSCTAIDPAAKSGDYYEFAVNQQSGGVKNIYGGSGQTWVSFAKVGN